MANGITGGGGANSRLYRQLNKPLPRPDNGQKAPAADADADDSNIKLPDLGSSAKAEKLAGEKSDQAEIVDRHMNRAAERLNHEMPGLNETEQGEKAKEIVKDAFTGVMEDTYLKPQLKRWEDQLDPTKKALDDWKDENPTKAKVATAGVVLAAGALAGSDGVEKAGIPLSKKYSFADDKVRLKLGAEFDAGYQNFGGVARLSSQHTWGGYNKHSVSGSIESNARGEGEAVAGYSYASGNGRSSFSSYVKSTQDGDVSSGLSYSHKMKNDGPLFKISGETGPSVDDHINASMSWRF